MKLKPLLIAVLVLGIIAGTGYYMKQRSLNPDDEDQRVGETLLSYDDLQDVAEVIVAKPKVSEQLQVKLDESGKWILPEYYEMPIDFSKLQNLIKTFQDGKIIRLANRNPEMFDRFDLDSGKITILNSAGETLWNINLGKQGTNGGTYVQFGEEQKIYLADISSYFDANQKNWPDKKLLPFTEEEIRRVSIPLLDGTGSIVAGRNMMGDPFSAEGLAENETLKESDLKTLISAFANSRFTDVATPENPDVIDAANNAQTLVFELFSGDTFTCNIGRRPSLPKIPQSPREGEGAGETPEMEAAGPVFMKIQSSDPDAFVNGMMEKLVPKYSEYLLNRLPKDRSALVNVRMEATTPPIAINPVQNPVPETIGTVLSQEPAEAEDLIDAAKAAATDTIEEKTEAELDLLTTPEKAGE